MRHFHELQRMRVCLLLATAVLGNPVWSAAQGEAGDSATPKESRVSFSTGISGWLMSQGQTRWNHDFSRLTYKDDSTQIGEVWGQVTVLKRWFVRGDFAYGGIGNGSLIDDDFRSANGPVESRTSSNLTGNNLWYVNGDIGVKAIQFPSGRGDIGFFTGFQYWRQKHQATDVVQTVCNPGVGLCDPTNTGQNLAPGLRAITNTSTWMSWRVGLDTNYHMTKKFILSGKFVFMPISYLTNDDIHHLRLSNVSLAGGDIIPALAQDPSFRMTGFGMGTDLEASAAYMILPHVALSIGYRFWWNWIHDGTLTQYTRDFGASSVTFDSFQTYRHGFTVGLRYTF